MCHATLKTYLGTRAVCFSHSGYSALFLPEMGANLISLKYHNIDILNSPNSLSDMLNEPYSYGIPLLCPPNRIQGARFCYDGKEYKFPSNLADGSHLHGVLHNTSWEIESLGADATHAYVVAVCDGSNSEQIRNCIGDGILFRIDYQLSKEGLKQLVSVQNQSRHIFPLGLAFHTAFKVPFCENSSVDDVLLQLPISTRCRLNQETFLPELVDDPLSDIELSIASQGYPPLKKQIDRLYKRDVLKKNEAVLSDIRNKVRIRYSAEDRYGYWIMWNNTTKEGFVGIEPQTWLTNAPYLADRGSFDLGIIEVLPNMTETLTTAIQVEEF